MYLRGIIKSAKDPVAQIEFDKRTPSGELGGVSGLLNDDELRRLQIRETIRSHLGYKGLVAVLYR